MASTDPWVRYARLSRGLDAPAEGELEEARRASVASPLVQTLLAELASWPGTVLASHRSAEQSFHLLSFAAELGARRGDPGVDRVAALVMGHVSEEGPFSLPMSISEAHGGTGGKREAWALCDAPVILRALLRMGFGGDPRVARALDHLIPLVRDNGYPCAASASLGSWRGPGRKSDPCPYATLVMLELLLELPARREGPEARVAAECLLHLWERSREEHPYIFWMGSDFRKLKAPLLWYDLLHVLEALSKADWLSRDPRLESMLELLEGKRGADGGFTPEAVYLRWKDQDFGRKKAPSAYLGAVAEGILARCGRPRA